ncbi:MAG: dual specificity protein phosphatase family protein [Myxococcales bacterium]|nr:MAG: dual specificity protein phosphatase family protein [Myxococcales bacterium]
MKFFIVYILLQTSLFATNTESKQGNNGHQRPSEEENDSEPATKKRKINKDLDEENKLLSDNEKCLMIKNFIDNILKPEVQINDFMINVNNTINSVLDVKNYLEDEKNSNEIITSILTKYPEIIEIINKKDENLCNNFKKGVINFIDYNIESINDFILNLRERKTDINLNLFIEDLKTYKDSLDETIYFIEDFIDEDQGINSVDYLMIEELNTFDLESYFQEKNKISSQGIKFLELILGSKYPINNFCANKVVNFIVKNYNSIIKHLNEKDINISFMNFIYKNIENIKYCISSIKNTNNDLYLKLINLDQNIMIPIEFYNLSQIDDFNKSSKKLNSYQEGKDRYEDILTFMNNFKYKLDNNRYINASVINFDDFSHKFIQSQAPLLGTIDDQWQMIWESDSKTTIMLTNFMESRRVKAICYWPKDCDDYLAGDITVSFMKKEDLMNGSLIKYTIIMKKNNKEKEHIILHYIKWPDHGVVDALEFLEIIKTVKSINEDNDNLIVHCSAGVGRAGTFISAYSIIYGSDNETNVYERVKQLKNQRIFSVQTEEQYKLVNDVVKLNNNN